MSLLPDFSVLLGTSGHVAPPFGVLPSLSVVPLASNLATCEACGKEEEGDCGNGEGDGSCEEEESEGSACELSPFAPLFRVLVATSVPISSPLLVLLLPNVVVVEEFSVAAVAMPGELFSLTSVGQDCAAAMIGTLMPSWHFTTVPSGLVRVGP